MSARFDVVPTRLEGLAVLARKPIRDHRGFLERMFCTSELEEVVGARRIVQINRTLTRARGAVRGLHFQRPPHAETKLVTCLRGRVFDVAVDLRRGSKTFLEWHAEELSEENHKTLVIPEGFAHGFQTRTNDCELLYLHTAAYAPDAEGGLNVRDPRLAIAWPEPIVDMSARDEAHPTTEHFEGLVP